MLAKTIWYIGIISMLLLFYACNQQSNKNTTTAPAPVTDTIKTQRPLTEQELEAQRKKNEEYNKTDSIRLDKVLTDVLKIAGQHISKNKFDSTYEIMPDSEYTLTITISSGNFFTKRHQHLIIHRMGPNGNYIDIYINNNNKYQKILSHTQWSMEYVNDTLRDINGDGLTDFVVNWYGSTGCCLKGFSNVYLLRPDAKSFSNGFEFINPTFSPAEKIIRGICYGHPGETEMYKYKWHGEAVDTIEYVGYERNETGKTGKINIYNKQPYGTNYKILRQLKDVPPEYKKIDGYDWFADKLEQ